MQFNSIPFLFYFLPVFLAVYYITPVKIKNHVLLLGSILFYGFCVAWRPLPLLVLAVSTVGVWLAGLWIQALSSKVIFWLSLGMMLLTLAFFKLYNGGRLLPGGMSFYLFQMSAYLVAVFTGRLQAQSNPVDFATEVWMFPKLLSGPLMEPDKLQVQMKDRQIRFGNLRQGVLTLIMGLALKVVVSNRIGGLWYQASVGGYESITTVYAWMALASFTMKLYFDFWGYSLMAMGLGQMLGFSIPENFRDPYCARSISEFYRRWHVTLGLWFRQNLYIPLGGSRKGNSRTVLNLLVVWLFTGLWHGVGGNYLLWAGILATCIVCERLFLGKYLEKGRIWPHVYTVLVAMLSWAPFAIGDWGKLRIFLGRLFGLFGNVTDPLDFLVWLEKYGLLLAVGVVLMTSLPGRLCRRLKDSWVAEVICFVLFWVSVYFIATAAQDPFMYGQY